MTASQQLQEAIRLHQAGKFAEARAVYERILSVQPDYAECHYLLATVLSDAKQIEKAIPEYQLAIELKPGLVAAHNDLGNAWTQSGNLLQAAACFKKVTELAPRLPQARYNLGNALKDAGQLDEAIESYRQAIELKPDYAEAMSNLGSAFLEGKSFDDAAHWFRRAIAVKPDYPVAHCGLGAALFEKKELTESIASSSQAIQLRPDYAEAHDNLGSAYTELGRFAEAMECYQQALEFAPDSTGTLNNVAKTFNNLDDPDNAADYLQRSLSIDPLAPETLGHLALIHKANGQIDLAVKTFQDCLALDPNLSSAQGGLLFCLLYHPDATPAAIQHELRKWNDRFARPLANQAGNYSNSRDAGKRLRIGYVSPDLKDSPVGRFMVSLLALHDPNVVEVHCFSEACSPPDEISRRSRRLCSAWHDTAGMPDQSLAELIRQEQIDILVDLALYTRGHRLLVFARKPAPVQVTFAGYPGSTGLDAIDYRLTDPFLDPPGLFDEFYSEESIRLPDTFWCNQFMSAEPAINELPAKTNGCITFGSLNNFCKTNDVLLRLWARVLQEVRESRLMILAPPGSARARVLKIFADLDIDTKRIIFVNRLSRADYLGLYHQIDIGLDPWPYGGHSTSFDALWMGVPQVTLVGKTVVGRAGLSLLSNLGLTDLAAHDENAYVKIASELAGDLPRLTELRRTLRDQMRKSPLTDGPKFARGIEAAYRMMWGRWCAAPPSAR